MHQTKEKKRGFNQTKIIANSLSKKIGVPVIDKIEKWVETESQTKKSIYQRWANQEKKFKLNNKSNMAGKHILIVDDVITTGATMHACLKLFEKMDTTISIACIAYS
jgi:ComF family protein